jgi:hypothetical protein
MVRFRHYGPNKFEPGKYYGLLIDWHPKYKGIDIYFGRHVFVFFRGYRK